MNIKEQNNNVKGSGKKSIKPKITLNVLSKRKTKELGKNLFIALQAKIDSLVNKLEYKDNKKTLKT